MEEKTISATSTMKKEMFGCDGQPQQSGTLMNYNI